MTVQSRHVTTVRRRRGVAVVVAAVLAVVATTVPPSAAQSGSAVVANPGPVTFTVTGGLLGLGTFDLPLPPCDPDGQGCLRFVANLRADGTFTVDPAALQLPRFDLPLDQLGLNLPIGLSVEAFTTGTTSGLIAPGGRLVRFNIALGIRLLPDLSGASIPRLPGGGFGSFLDLSCRFGPVRIAATSAGSGRLTGTPYDAGTGQAGLVDGTYTVPPLTCSPLITTLLPLLAGDALGGININELLATANDTLGLPTAMGDAAVRLDVAVTGATAPPTPGGIVWPATAFRDVRPGAFFDTAVRWLTAHGITTGVNNNPTVFAPGDDVTRGQMAAFLWRMMDQRPASATCGFADVPSGASFDRAVCWLAANAVTNGVDPAGTRFAPSRPVTRVQMALFLHRLAGSPPAGPVPRFTDVPAGTEVAAAVDWLRRHNLTTGLNNSPTRFGPSGTVTRGQMAAFLYRLATTPAAWGDSVVRPATAMSG